MIKRQLIRQLVIDALTNPATVINGNGDTGLTLANNRVHDTALDPLQLQCEGRDTRNDLPAIAVYTERERLGADDKNKWRFNCFNDSTLLLVIELYACAKNGIELEALLDRFEGQVRYKLLKNKPLLKQVEFTGYQSDAQRSGDGRRLGKRLLQLELKYTESLEVVESLTAETPFIPNLTVHLDTEYP